MPSQLLLVEDDPLLRQSLQQHLQRRGFAVTACATGSQALEAIRRCEFELVLLDIMLPEVDGLTLLDVHVCNLRRKLGEIGAGHLQIQAVRGQGYVLVEVDSN